MRNAMDREGEASQSQPRGRGRGRGRPFNHRPLSSPPPPDVVRDEQSEGVGVSVSLSVSMSGSNSRSIKDGRKTSHYNINKKQLHLHVSDKLNICDDRDHGEDISQTRTRSSTTTTTTTTTTITTTTTTTTRQTQTEPFDICPPKQGGSVVLKPPLLVKNRERRNETKKSSSRVVVLRPGMVLLKGYIPLSEQVQIVKRCRELGVGCGGFYQPGYGEGTKLHLKMMCLGMNWDPLTSQYGPQRPSDGAHPPRIPPEFLQLVDSAIRDSHALIQQQHSTITSTSTSNPHHLLPSISPDICIVNFYSQNGRLGLHQDKDESDQSLRRGLPVVSFSIGDSADFLYGHERDVDQAHKLLLESGDVLIFGGESRNIFHGITAIHPNTAPNLLLQETNLRPGRLNLTFRQY